MKRTNIVLDEKLVGKGMRLTGIETQKGLIDYALFAFDHFFQIHPHIL